MYGTIDCQITKRPQNAWQIGMIIHAAFLTMHRGSCEYAEIFFNAVAESTCDELLPEARFVRETCIWSDSGATLTSWIGITMLFRCLIRSVEHRFKREDKWVYIAKKMDDKIGLWMALQSSKISGQWKDYHISLNARKGTGLLGCLHPQSRLWAVFQEIDSDKSYHTSRQAASISPAFAFESQHVCSRVLGGT